MKYLEPVTGSKVLELAQIPESDSHKDVDNQDTKWVPSPGKLIWAHSDDKYQYYRIGESIYRVLLIANADDMLNTAIGDEVMELAAQFLKEAK